MSKAVEIWFKDSGVPYTHSDVISTSTQELFYCISEPGIITKYPVADIWRVVETVDQGEQLADGSSVDYMEYMEYLKKQEDAIRDMCRPAPRVGNIAEHEHY